MRMPKCCNNPCFRDRKLRALCTVSFGLGMVLAQISPEGLVLFIGICSASESCRKRHNTKLHITKRLTAGNSEPFAYYVMIEFRKA